MQKFQAKISTENARRMRKVTGKAMKHGKFFDGCSIILRATLKGMRCLYFVIDAFLTLHSESECSWTENLSSYPKRYWRLFGHRFCFPNQLWHPSWEVRNNTIVLLPDLKF